MFPDADIPVVQLSVDETRPPDHHLETGARLKIETQKDKTSSRHGPIDPEYLKRDWQVVRALEILVGYDIFKGINQEAFELAS